MIRKIIFGFIWFIVIYTGCGILYVFLTKGGVFGNFQEAYQIGLEFRHTYFKIIGTVVMFIIVIGTITSLLPGTKKKTITENK
ncbi:MAG: hypothetical protein MUP22_04355 [Desulfobacterales bacterium]|jgi:hypothetical protein|nr:hypothetical protein [Desulfobacterales bacterium]